MANRIVVDELKEIISTNLDDTDLDAYITAANLLVTDLLGGNAYVSDAQLKEIERWLAAHLLASTRAKQAQAEGVDKANITYQGKTGMGLDFTSYGQMAKVLDPTGILANSIGKRKASITAVTSFSD
jgi:hypothetical protein